MNEGSSEGSLIRLRNFRLFNVNRNELFRNSSTWKLELKLKLGKVFFKSFILIWRSHKSINVVPTSSKKFEKNKLCCDL